MFHVSMMEKNKQSEDDEDPVWIPQAFRLGRLKNVLGGGEYAPFITPPILESNFIQVNNTALSTKSCHFQISFSQGQ